MLAYAGFLIVIAYVCSYAHTYDYVIICYPVKAQTRKGKSHEKSNRLHKSKHRTASR